VADWNLRAGLVALKNINNAFAWNQITNPGGPSSSPISVATEELNISYCIGDWNVDWIYLAEKTVQSEYENESPVSVKFEESLDYLSDC
jgi:hypothetical protein